MIVELLLRFKLTELNIDQGVWRKNDLMLFFGFEIQLWNYLLLKLSYHHVITTIDSICVGFDNFVCDNC